MPFLSIEQCAAASGLTVVVDVMRAFTFAPWALHQGAERLVLVDTLEDALALKARIPGSLAAQDGKPLPGFDLYNSPAELRRRDLTGKTVVQRTTAGTRGVLAARHCTPLLCASYTTASATAAFLRSTGATSVNYVVTGGNGAAEEDLSCAEFIDARRLDPRCEAGSFVERARGSNAAERLLAGAAAGFRSIDPHDVGLCLEVDRFDFYLATALGKDGIEVEARRVQGRQRRPIACVGKS